MKDEEVISLYKLRDSTWTFKGAHGHLHFYFQICEQAINPLKEYWGDCPDIALFFIKNNYIRWYWHDKSLRRLRKELLKRVDKNPEIIEKLKFDWLKRIKHLEKVMKEIDKKNVSDMSNTELTKQYLKLSDAYVNEYSLAITLQDAFSMYAEEFMVPHFKNIIGDKKFEEYFIVLTKPVFESLINQEYQERIKIFLKKKEGLDINDDIKKHSEKYYWLKNNYAKEEFLDEKYFKELIDHLESEKELEKQELVEDVIEERKKTDKKIKS